jgi:hypothetical protein
VNKVVKTSKIGGSLKEEAAMLIPAPAPASHLRRRLHRCTFADGE